MNEEQKRYRKPVPGVSRDDRLSAEGLQRLEKQLQSRVHVSPMVLAQWIRRYGEDARKLVAEYGKLSRDVEELL